MNFAPIPASVAAQALASMVGNGKWDTSDGLLGVDDLLRGANAFCALEDGRPLMLIVISYQQYQACRELLVRVARQLVDDGDLTERALPAIEREFGDGCASVQIITRRAGLVRKLQRQGYDNAATIMRKKL